MSNVDLEKAVEVARRAVEAASARCMSYFGGELGLKLKADQSPVTLADQASEAIILETIRAQFPDHSVLTEESGAHAGRKDLRWIIDPLDGTRGFSRGGIFWGPLVALEAEGEVVAGACALPAVGRTYWAGRGLGAFRDGKRLALSAAQSWAQSTLSAGELHKLLAPELAAPFKTLATSCASTRAYGDVGGCAMLLDGLADAWIEAGVQIWDIAPLKVLVEESGGIFTDLKGNKTIANGQALAANPALHAHALGVFQRG